MSTIRSTNAAGLTGTATNLMSGLAKVWAQAALGDALTDDYNLSSITDSGTGDATWNIANAMSDSDFGTASHGSNYHCRGFADTTSAIDVNTDGATHSASDAEVGGTAHGDLA
jgi:hypothetical protein